MHKLSTFNLDANLVLNNKLKVYAYFIVCTYTIFKRVNKLTNFITITLVGLNKVY